MNIYLIELDKLNCSNIIGQFQQYLLIWMDLNKIVDIWGLQNPDSKMSLGTEEIRDQE